MIATIDRYGRRASRRATAFGRPLPGILVVGGMRCGSTSVYKYLIEAGFTGGTRKEVRYFDRSYSQSEGWYRSFFSLSSGRGAVDASPTYLTIPGTAARAQAVVPDVRVVALLRNPRDRAVSHFNWRRSRGHETCGSLEEAIHLELDGTRTIGTDIGCYLGHSQYARGLEEWRTQFGPERVCVLIAERLFEGEQDELERLAAHVNVAPGGSFPKRNMGPKQSPLDISDKYFADTVHDVERLIGRKTGWVIDA